MRNYRKLTVQQLRKAGACKSQVQLFRDTFGESVNVTVKRAEKYAQQFDFRFAALHFLSDAAQDEFDRVHWVAFVEYNKARDAAEAGYDAVCIAARAEYGKALDATYAEYRRVCAAIFAKLYIAEQ